jgi:hypothetical protein
MQQIRASLRGRGVVLMGKNTCMRKAIRGHLDQNPSLEKILPCIRGNVGFVFTSEELTDIRELIQANKVGRVEYVGVVSIADSAVITRWLPLPRQELLPLLMCLSHLKTLDWDRRRLRFSRPYLLPPRSLKGRLRSSGKYI